MNSIFRPRPVSLVAAAVAFAIGGIATAQDKPPDSTDQESDRASALTEVIVTGTRRTDRTAAESSAPIDIISGTELGNPASGNMLDALAHVVPSFSIGQNSISDASSFVRAPSLRGLPGDQMLTMLNGKRFNRSALVQVFQGGETALSFGSQGPDLASIPSIAIASLEILRDGAVAQYGSDAIAGVLNYHFRENSSGVELDARYGSYYPGDFVDIKHYAPNDRVNLGLDYNWDRIWVSLRGNYYGSFRNEQDYPGQLFSENTTVDAEFSYQVTDQITASIGGRNIFDEYPDVIDGVDPLTGGLGDGERYPRTGGPFGYNGAFFYARVGVKF